MATFSQEDLDSFTREEPQVPTPRTFSKEDLKSFTQTPAPPSQAQRDEQLVGPPSFYNEVKTGVKNALNAGTFNVFRNGQAAFPTVAGYVGIPGYENKGFERYFQEQRAYDDALNRQNPKSAMAGTVAGTIGAGIAAPQAFIGRTLLGTAAKGAVGAYADSALGSHLASPEDRQRAGVSAVAGAALAPIVKGGTEAALTGVNKVVGTTRAPIPPEGIPNSNPGFFGSVGRSVINEATNPLGTGGVGAMVGGLLGHDPWLGGTIGSIAGGVAGASMRGAKDFAKARADQAAKLGYYYPHIAAPGAATIGAAGATPIVDGLFAFTPSSQFPL